MAEKIPSAPSDSFDETAHRNNEQNAAVGKAGECSTTGQSISGQQPLTNEEQKQKIREIYNQGKAIPKAKQSEPRLEEFKKSLIEKNRQELGSAVKKSSEIQRKPSTGSSSPSIS